jgi:hypothetical protein
MREIGITITMEDNLIVEMRFLVSEEVAKKLENQTDVRLRIYVLPKDFEK